MDVACRAIPCAVTLTSRVIPNLGTRALFRRAVDALAVCLIESGALRALIFGKAAVAVALLVIEDEWSRAILLADAVTGLWVLNEGSFASIVFTLAPASFAVPNLASWAILGRAGFLKHALALIRVEHSAVRAELWTQLAYALACPVVDREWDWALILRQLTDLIVEVNVNGALAHDGRHEEAHSADCFEKHFFQRKK